MRRRLTLVEVIIVGFIVIATVAITWFVSQNGTVYRIERPLKQFVVNQGGLSGSLFLGCGPFSGSERKYYFYKIGKGGKFRPAVVSLDRVTIVEDGQNKVIFITKPLRMSRLDIENEIDSKHFNLFSSYIKNVEFHIPPGSLLEIHNPNLSSAGSGYLSVKRCIEKDEIGKCVKEEIITPGSSPEQ